MTAEQGARLYPNSGEPSLLDLKGNLWRVEADCWIDTGVTGKPFHIPALPAPGEPVNPLSWVAERLTNGRLIVRKGYVHDGSSIPWFGRWLDRRVSGWPALVHDVQHEAMRAGVLPQSEFVPAARLYSSMMRAFGAWAITSKLCFVGLWLFGRRSAKRAPEYPVRNARGAA